MFQAAIRSTTSHDYITARSETPADDSSLNLFDFAASPPVEAKPAISDMSALSAASHKFHSMRPPSPTPVTSRSSTRTPFARGRSTTANTTTSAPIRMRRSSRYPTPPPRSNPLGPSAQPPYLPAKSEYGGPDIDYSYRPGGPCLYDLLNTLPLEPYGVLSWDILDREDEIYERDNMKGEHKVMHALWARWIVLNR